MNQIQNSNKFSQKIKKKVKDYLIKVCKVKNISEADILEFCQSIYYLGKANDFHTKQLSNFKKEDWI